MIRFALPSLGADMDEGTLLAWHVKPGDAVRRGQVVAVVDTSKAAVDVEIWHDGVVGELLVQPGEKIPVGTVLATVLEAGEQAGAAGGAVPAAQAAPTVQTVAPARTAPPSPQAAPTVPSTAAAPTVPAAAAAAAPATQPGPAPAATPVQPATAPRPPVGVPSQAGLAGPGGALRAAVSPSARRRAHELGVDPEALHGTGPHGSVTLADVESAAGARGTAAAAAPAPPGSAAAAPTPAAASAGPVGAGAVPTAAAVSAAQAAAAAAPAVGATAAATAVARQQAMRAAIAAAMSRSKREIPHYYLSESIPMAVALDWLRQRNAGRPITERILPAALLLKAVAVALARTPELNGLFRDGRFEPAAAVHAGVAISLRGGGLVAPAIHDVGVKTVEQLMADLADLVKRARAGSLRSSEMSDPTITVTNLGDQGVEAVFGVIYPPQVALVGFGRTAERAWAQDGWIRSMPVVTASLAADHRVSDGHRGALFLAELRDLLQQPQSLAGSAP